MSDVDAVWCIIAAALLTLGLTCVGNWWAQKRRAVRWKRR